MTPYSHRPPFLAVLTLLGTLSGCSDDGGDNTPPKETGTSPSTPAPEVPDAGAEPPVKKGSLLIMTEVAAPEGGMHYLHILPDWPASGKLEGKGRELGAQGVAHVEGNAFYFYRGNDGAMDKLTIDADGKVSAKTTMSYARYGIKGFDPETIWVAPDLAFTVDEKTGLVIRFNPGTMEIAESYKMNPSVLERDGLDGQFQNGVAAAGRLFTVANWRSWKPPQVIAVAALGVFTQDAPTNGPQIIEDDRCAPSVAAPVYKEDGYLYVVGDGSTAFDIVASEKPVKKPQCVVRMAEAGSAFDPDYFVNLNEVTSSKAIRMAYPMGNQKLLVNMWSPDISLPPEANTANSSWFWDATAYEFAVVDLKTKTSTRVANLRGKMEGQKVLIVDGKNYVQVHRPDRGSVLYRIEPDATATTVLTNGAATNVQFLGRL